MSKTKKNMKDTSQLIGRKEALKQIGDYGKFAAITALGTYLMLSPKRAQAASPEDPGSGF